MKKSYNILFVTIVLGSFIYIWRIGYASNRPEDFMNYVISSNEYLFIIDNSTFKLVTFDLRFEQNRTLVYRYFTGSCSKCLIEDIHNLKFIKKRSKNIYIRILINEPKTKQSRIMLQSIL